jgi:hypothetical protein
MHEESQDNEISLIDLWHRKVLIIVITLIAIIGVLVFSVLTLFLSSVNTLDEKKKSNRLVIPNFHSSHLISLRSCIF